MVVVDASQVVSQDTVEFAVLADARPQPTRTAVEPFRSTATDLVDLFGMTDAGMPSWHRRRACDLRREAHAHPVAAVTDAYVRLAARHVATAELLEQQDRWAETA